MSDDFNGPLADDPDIAECERRLADPSDKAVSVADWLREQMCPTGSYAAAMAADLKRLTGEREALATLLGGADVVERVGRLVEELRAVEWGDTTPEEDGGFVPCCPSCGHRKDNGHAGTCELAAALPPRPAETPAEEKQ